MENKLVTRSAQLKSFNKETRSFTAVAATEIPAKVFDWERGVIDEVLLSDGFRLTKGREKKVPLLNAHNRYNVESVLGSVGNWRKEGNEILADPVFADTPEAEKAMSLYRDGHMTDVSIGYSVDEAHWIEEGETKTVNGRVFNGPMRLVTRYTVKELSLVPIGADPGAVARADTTTSKEVKNMDPKFKEWLIRMGHDPEKLSEQQILSLRAEYDKVSAPPPAKTPPVVDLEAIKAQGRAEEQTRVRAITELCKTAKREDLAGKFINDPSMTPEKAAPEIIREMSAGRPATDVTGGITLVADENDKFRAAVQDGLAVRHQLRVEKPAAGHENFRYRTLLSIAEECLKMNKVDTRGLTKAQIAERALGLRGEYPVIPLNTGSFTAILENTANKKMLQGFAEARSTWRNFCRVGNLPDFKNNTRVALSGAPNLKLKAEGAEYEFGSFSDKKETYALGTYARKTGITREAIVNDDQDAFSAIPMAYGFAAGRIPDTLAYAILTGNPAMVDGKALFHADHKNVTTGVLSTTSISALRNLLRLQKGFGSDTEYLDIEMAVLLVPIELEFTADIVVHSATLPEAGYPAGVPNPIQRKNITVVSSPRLSADSTVEFYGAANPNAFPTIEVGFLDGLETPELFRVDQTDPDGVIWIIRYDVGAKALDFRGLAYSSGV